MSCVIGIDLGTTSSRVSVMREGEIVPVIIENAEGDGTTPSHVAITDSGLRLVGKPARRYALKDPGNAVFSIKRLIGRSFDDPIVQKLKKIMPYKIVKAKNGDAWVRLHGKDYSPEQITAFTLQKMRASAEAYLGESITEAVITVPAYFSDSQRRSTIDAAKIAGLDVTRMIAEPTAAALSYRYGKSKGDEKIAVYDLGGGTFDISIIEIAEIDGEYQFEVLSMNGDTFLGGEDFDIKLVEYIASEYQKNNHINLLDDPIAIQRLKEAAETAKIILSTELSAEIDLPFITIGNTGVKHLNITITRELFESLIFDLIHLSIDICERALKDAGLNVKEVDQVILVGGSTRIPLVQKSLQQFFRNKLYEGTRREDFVALGAAIQAGIFTSQVKDLLLLDVIPFSLGIETSGGLTSRLIERNTIIPTIYAKIFSTDADNQDVFSVHIVQGEKELASKNETLGRFELTGITPAPKGIPEIEVSFDIDANGALKVSATERASLEFQVGNLCKFAASDSLTVEQRKALCDTINSIFKDKIKPPVTTANIGNAKDSLADAIAIQYPIGLGKLIEFLYDVDNKMGNDNPLSTFKRQDKGTGNKKSIVVNAMAKGRLNDDEIKKLAEAAQNHTVQNEPQSTNDNFVNDLNQALSNNASKSNSDNADKLQGIFISYAHEDSIWAKEIQKSLSMVALKNGYEVWIDRMIGTGDYWEERIYSEIERSNIAILILSRDFLCSHFILKNELPRIFAEKERRYLQVFPIMVRSCPFQLHEELAKFQFFNDPEKPFASLQPWEVDNELTRLAYELANNKMD